MRGPVFLAVIVIFGAIRAHAAAPGPTNATCVDKLDTCTLLDRNFYCSGDFLQYAYHNCRNYCNLCNLKSPPTTVTPTTSSTLTPEWMIFLKGVAGAPGPDLYQLWHSSWTLNSNIPQAQNLTAEFNGHYKPDYSNHWKDLCIDEVKVSIFKNGLEKAFITFNATGTDKNSWFTSDRIISSTWTDLKASHKEIFSLAGDANTGREFYVSGQSSKYDSCDSFGWIMVSTNSTCFFEAGDKKPSFYYAPGTSQSHWGYTNPGTGDVFAIQAHSQCPPHVTRPTEAAGVCTYRNKQYTQDQHWTDGCKYNCSCEDATIGYYKCKDVCPMYVNLPSGCRLQTKPGECCAEPVCTTSEPQQQGPFCVYKGQNYTQGETWNDGCSQTCTCSYAKSGFYSCRATCLTWTNLPSICHMEDQAQPLCCKQPKCPADVILDIPKAYKDQYPGYNYV